MAGESQVPVERPEGLPEQFNSWAAMAESYKELQAKSTQQAQELAAAATPETKEPAPKQTDSLSTETASALENIATFNEERRNDRFVAQVGVEGLGALNEYLKGEAIPAPIKAAYEAALESGSEALIDANFALVKSTFEASHGTFDAPANAVAGVPGGGVIIPAGTVPFRSHQEQKDAQADPRYKTDSAFRKDVEMRIALGS
jgi:hypothetical protein